VSPIAAYTVPAGVSDPALELRRSSQVGPLQKPAGVQDPDTPEISDSGGLLQLSDVVAQTGGGPELGGPRNGFLSGIPTQAIEGLGESMPDQLVAGVGPGHSDHPLA